MDNDTPSHRVLDNTREERGSKSLLSRRLAAIGLDLWLAGVLLLFLWLRVLESRTAAQLIHRFLR